MYYHHERRRVLFTPCRGILNSLPWCFIDLKQHLEQLRNYHGMTAVGKGLYATNFQPSRPSRVWALLNPEKNFAACRELMIMCPGLPFLSPEIHELHASGMGSAQLLKVFYFVQYFGKREEESPGLGTKGAARTLYRNICTQLYTYCISCGGN